MRGWNRVDSGPHPVKQATKRADGIRRGAHSKTTSASQLPSSKAFKYNDRERGWNHRERMTTIATQNSGARSVASVKMGNPSLVFGRCLETVNCPGSSSQGRFILAF